MIFIYCNFEFQCPNDWDELELTENFNVRFCKQCQQNVHKANSDEELTKLVSQKKCVAIQTAEGMYLGVGAEEKEKYQI